MGGSEKTIIAKKVSLPAYRRIECLWINANFD
jgi:hypothetical protein